MLKKTADKFLPIYADAIREIIEKQSRNQAGGNPSKSDVPSNLMNDNQNMKMNSDFIDQVRVLKFCTILLLVIM